jgi:CHAD domain-containing protein
VSGRRRDWVAQARAALVDALLAAADRFPAPGGDDASNLHEARRALKRAASLARLFAPIVGDPAEAALDVVNSARRCTGRARDLDVAPGVLAKLKCAPDTRETLMRAIATERDAAREGRPPEDGTRFRAKLADCAREVGEWSLAAHDTDSLLRSLRVSYRAANRAGRRAWASGHAGDLHRLRSRIVDLHHQSGLFAESWPAMFDAYGEALRRLRQTLGDHADLTVLGEFALARPELDGEGARALVARATKRRRPLERRAAAQFARLFAERPGAFARRLSAYLAHPLSGKRARAAAGRDLRARAPQG